MPPEPSRSPDAASIHEPRVQKDGLCANQNCRKKLPRSARAKKYAGHWLDLDPWCSARCCRAFHGVVIPHEENPALADVRARGGRKNADRYKKARKALAA